MTGGSSGGNRRVCDDPKRVGGDSVLPMSCLWGGWAVGVQAGRIRWSLMDDLDVAFRYTACVAAIVSLILYLPTELRENELPSAHLAGISATIIFAAPFSGAAVSGTLSWILGTYTAVFLSFLTTLILGTSTESVTVDIMQSCAAPLPALGEVGSPSPYLAAAIIFLANLCISYCSVDPLWGKSATLAYNINVLIWFIAQKSALAVKLGPIQFVKLGNTSIIGCLFAVLCLAFPLPLFNASPRLLPLPRQSVTSAVEKLHSAGSSLFLVFEFLKNEYEAGNVYRMKEGTLELQKLSIDSSRERIKRARVLLLTSGRWEIILPLHSVRFGTLMKYAEGLETLSLQLGTLVLLFRDKLNKAVPFQHTSTWDDTQNYHLFGTLDRMLEAVNVSLQSIQDCRVDEEAAERLEAEVDNCRMTVMDLFQGVDVSEQITEIGREKAFHCFCLWKFINIGKTVIELNHIFEKNEGPLFLRR